MNEYVKVSMGSDGIVQEEIIKKDYLRKVVKWYGNTGTQICFEWFDPVANLNRQWVRDFGSVSIRDEVFDEYEIYLTGTYITNRSVAHIRSGDKNE